MSRGVMDISRLFKALPEAKLSISITRPCCNPINKAISQTHCAPNRHWCSWLKDIICSSKDTLMLGWDWKGNVIPVPGCRYRKLIDFVCILNGCRYHKNSVMRIGLLLLVGISECSLLEHVLCIASKNEIFCIVKLNGLDIHTSMISFQCSWFN